MKARIQIEVSYHPATKALSRLLSLLEWARDGYGITSYELQVEDEDHFTTWWKESLVAKYKRKVQIALESRRRAWDAMNTEDRKGTTKPGSQNRKKGYGTNGRRR